MCGIQRPLLSVAVDVAAQRQPRRVFAGVPSAVDLTDEARRTIIAGKHLLSVRDMDLSPDLEALMDAGVTSFKIEGRLKDLRYIKNVVSYYRDRLDEILSRRWKDYMRSSCGRTVREFEPDPSKSFTRGATEYMLHGKRRGVASFDTPKAVGEYVGRVTGLVRGGFRMDGAVPLAAGDGICTVSASGAAGTNVNRVDGPLVYPNRMSGIVSTARWYIRTVCRASRSARRYTATTTTASHWLWTAAARDAP